MQEILWLSWCPDRGEKHINLVSAAKSRTKYCFGSPSSWDTVKITLYVGHGKLASNLESRQGHEMRMSLRTDLILTCPFCVSTNRRHQNKRHHEQSCNRPVVQTCNTKQNACRNTTSKTTYKISRHLTDLTEISTLMLLSLLFSHS